MDDRRRTLYQRRNTVYASDHALMAGATPRIRKGLARLRDELPGVAGCVQSQLEHTVRIIIPNFTIRFDGLPAIMTPAAGPDDKLTQALRRVRHAGWVLRREPFVIVIVAAQHHVGLVIIERLPDGLQGQAIAVQPGAKAWMMPIRQSAERRMLFQLVLFRMAPLSRIVVRRVYVA